jgi:hypothetical protein
MALIAWSRDITVAGFSAEANPNTSPPAANKIWAVGRYRSGSAKIGGHFLVGRYDTEETTGTAAFTTWWRDVGGTQWYQLTDAATLTHRKLAPTTAVLEGEIFVQVTALANAGSATKFVLAGGPLEAT